MTLYHQEIKDRFHLQLGRLVHAYSQFDFNVGLTLGWLGPHHGEDVSALLISKIPLAERLKKLKPLVMKTYKPAGEIALAEFETWFAKARELKAIRNDHVHARWGIPSHCESDDPVLKMLPMNWDFTPEHPDASVDVTLSGLAEQAVAIEKLTAEFSMLLKKLVAHAVPAYKPPRI